MSKKNIIQWHPAFCSAIMLELKDNYGDLSFEREHNLGRAEGKPCKF